MKSEHRHELQTNELSKLTKKAIEKTEKHGLKIAAALCVLTVAVMGYRLYSHNVTRTQRMAWYEFSTAQTSGKAEGYAEVAENPDNKGTAAANWALLLGAETRSAQAIQDMFTDRENAVSALNTARAEFEKLVGHKHFTIKQRAIFGLARSEESLGNLEKARTQYEILAGSAFETSVYHEEAKERLEYLKQGGPQAFYAWFMKQNPRPPEPPKPQDGGSLPGGGLDIPEDFPFGLGLPSASEGNPPPAEGKTPSEKEELSKSLPTLDEPAVETPKESGETPVAPKEGAEESETPATETGKEDTAEKPDEGDTEQPKEGDTQKPDDEK